MVGHPGGQKVWEELDAVAARNVGRVPGGEEEGDGEEGTFQVSVKTERGSQFFDVSGLDTVGTLEKKVKSFTKSAAVVLLFESQWMQSHRTLKSYGVGPRSTMDWRARMHGGGRGEAEAGPRSRMTLLLCCQPVRSRRTSGHVRGKTACECWTHVDSVVVCISPVSSLALSMYLHHFYCPASGRRGVCQA